MQFQPNLIIFDCGTLVRLYLAKATDILIQTHNQSNQGDIYNLTDTFKLKRENIKQLFTLVLQKAGTLTIAANQITKILRDVIKDTAVTKIRILSKDILLRLVTQKVHVHGLVLHDVIAMLEDDITEENINYLKEYFENLFLVFNKKFCMY